MSTYGNQTRGINLHLTFGRKRSHEDYITENVRWDYFVDFCGAEVKFHPWPFKKNRFYLKKWDNYIISHTPFGMIDFTFNDCEFRCDDESGDIPREWHDDRSWW